MLLLILDKVSGVSENAIMLVLFFLLWKIITEKKIKTFVEPSTCLSQLSKWNAICDSSTYPVPIDKTLTKK